MMRILPALFYSTIESYDAEFVSPKPRLQDLSMKIHDTKLKLTLPMLNHKWCSVGTNDKPVMEGSWIKIFARDENWSGTFMFSTKKNGRRTADWAVENPFLEDSMVINDELMELTVNLKVPDDFKGAVPKFLIYACGTGGRYPFRSIWKSPHGKYRGAIALSPSVEEEPCPVLDCLPYQTIANADENGCGGECVSIKCTDMGCERGEGDCDDDSHCVEGLKCGRNNCDESKGFGPKDDCCYDESLNDDPCGGKDCCTEDAPCDEGKGDCQIDSDCAGDLKCGVNNCNQAHGYHPKDDCCYDPSNVQECKDDETKMEDCNMCKCVSGNWACTRKACIEKGYTTKKNWMKMMTVTKQIKITLPMDDNKWCAAGTNDKPVMDGSWTKIWPRDSKWSGNFIWSTLADGKRKPEIQLTKKNPWLPEGMVIKDNIMHIVISLKHHNKVPVPRYILYACGKGSRYSYKNTGLAPHGTYRGAIDLESSEHTH